ncbi:hypothetical protein [Pseudomonas sp. NFIX10]|uniref:DUF6990 domain-containing protein n=1 Tax=unclassified Pseudomonas TaxID=196821 RepID=UPI0035305C97
MFLGRSNGRKDIVSILSEQGWVCSKDEVGDYFCVIDVGEVQLRAEKGADLFNCAVLK